MTKEERKKQIEDDTNWLINLAHDAPPGTTFTPTGTATAAYGVGRIAPGNASRYWGQILQDLQIRGIVMKTRIGVYMDSHKGVGTLAPVKATERIETQPVKPQEDRIGSPQEYQDIAKEILLKALEVKEVHLNGEVPKSYPTHFDTIKYAFRAACRTKGLFFKGFGEDTLQNTIADMYLAGVLRCFRRNRQDVIEGGNPELVEFVYQASDLPPLFMGGWTEFSTNRRVLAPAIPIVRRDRGRKVIGEVKQ